MICEGSDVTKQKQLQRATGSILDRWQSYIIEFKGVLLAGWKRNSTKHKLGQKPPSMVEVSHAPLS